MDKKYKILLGTSAVGLAAIITPILITSCSNQVEKVEHSSIWNLDGNKKFLYLENHNLGSDLNDIKIVNDADDTNIEFDRENSKISNDELFISLINPVDTISSFKIVNEKTNAFKIINNNAVKTFKEYDLVQDQKYFFELIKDMSVNGIPTLGTLRNASLVIQQAFYISLINYFSNSNSEQDKTFLFGDSVVWKENRFNQQTLIDKKIWDGNLDFWNANYQKFNLFQDETIIWNTQQMISVFETIMKKENITYFDFFHDEIEFMNNLMNFDSNYFSFIFKHANKLIILSDGANHTNSTVPKLTNLLNAHQLTRSREEVIQMLKDLRNNKLRKLSQSDVLDILLLKNYEHTNENSKFNYVSFINYDGNIFNATSLNDNKKFNESAFSTNFVEYKDCVNNEANKSKFLETFSELFVNEQLDINKIIVNGLDQYDPNKKNAIFLGSSLFKPFKGNVSENNFSRLDALPNILNEIQTTMTNFLKKYDPKEYNIIFKLHPVFSNSDDPKHLGAINYVKQITNNSIDKPILINSRVPLETLISLDYYNYSKNPQGNDNFIFRKNNNTQAYEWTTFFGLQATTTTIHTTRLFYQSAFNLTKERVAELIPFSNFPVPKLFHVVNRMEYDNYSTSYTQDNINQINKIYSPFCPSIKYADLGLNDLSKYDSIILNFNN